MSCPHRLCTRLRFESGASALFSEAAPLQESLALAHELGDRDGIGGADAVFEVIEADLDPAERDLHERTLAEVRDRLGDEAFAAAWAEGRAMGLPEAVAYARDRLGSSPGVGFDTLRRGYDPASHSARPSLFR